MSDFFAYLILILAAASVTGQTYDLESMDSATEDRLSKIGSVVAANRSAALVGPYENPAQQAVPFGTRSFQLAPWRAYVDTWPGTRLSESLGVVFNTADLREAGALAAVLGEAGFRHARIEIGWGAFDFEAPGVLDQAERWAQILSALREAGLRPLILLNANSSQPVPTRRHRSRLTRPAAAGDRAIYLSHTDEIEPGKTGLMGQAYPSAFPLFTAVDRDSGRVSLSAPLEKELPAGVLELATLRYAPLGGVRFADGRINPEAALTLEGWQDYVRHVCRFASETLGTVDQEDPGFDLEVWNELSFGSQFLNEDHYYDPDREFAEGLSFETEGQRVDGFEVLLPLAIEAAHEALPRATKLKIINGFSNQRPWDHGGDRLPGQAGFSRHYYVDLALKHRTQRGGLVTPESDRQHFDQPIRDALGRTHPAGSFVPTFWVNHPEYWFYAYQTEFMGRDLQPMPGPFENHFRFSHRGDGVISDVWASEHNVWREPWAVWLMQQTDVDRDDERLLALLEETAAKAVLRSWIFQTHQGVRVVCFYAAKDRLTQFGLVAPAFFEAIRRRHTRPIPQHLALKTAGRQVQALANVTAFLKRESSTVEIARPIGVTRLVEYEPRLVFEGDGSAGQPDRFHRDDFACLPFQLDDGTFAVGYYVVTRDLLHPWQPQTDLLDPRRYRMPEQRFDLTLSGLLAEGASAEWFDPLTRQRESISAQANDDGTLTLPLPVVDYPRFLLIREASPGPLLRQPRVVRSAQGSATVSVRANRDAGVVVSWGELPERTSGGEVTLEQVRPVEGLDGWFEFRVELKGYQPGHGVRFRLVEQYREAVWPRWGHDTAGVVWP